MRKLTAHPWDEARNNSHASSQEQAVYAVHGLPANQFAGIFRLWNGWTVFLTEDKTTRQIGAFYKTIEEARKGLELYVNQQLNGTHR